MNYLQMYVYQLASWEQMIVRPFFAVHRIPVEITKEVFEQEIAHTF
jgi:hypothetical protein